MQNAALRGGACRRSRPIPEGTAPIGGLRISFSATGGRDAAAFLLDRAALSRHGGPVPHEAMDAPWRCRAQGTARWHTFRHDIESPRHSRFIRRYGGNQRGPAEAGNFRRETMNRRGYWTGCRHRRADQIEPNPDSGSVPRIERAARTVGRLCPRRIRRAVFFSVPRGHCPAWARGALRWRRRGEAAALARRRAWQKSARVPLSNASGSSAVASRDGRC